MNFALTLMLELSLLIPLFSGLLEIIFRRGYILTACSLLTLILLVFSYLYVHGQIIIRYLNIGNLSLALSFSKTWILYAIAATLIIFLVELYSIGYLWDDYRRAWFFSFSGLMHFGTLLLFFSDDLITIAISWNILELCSYALIGHWYRDEVERYVGEGVRFRDMILIWSPSQAAYRAIVITSAGTSMMLVASCLAYSYIGSVLLTSLAKLKNNLIQILILIASLVPSAQVPFTEWLYTAMAGPTPASAMIHSTTLVNVGAFTILKIASYLPCPHSTIETFLIYVIISTIVSGLIGIASREVKVILAASTTIYVGLLLYTSLLYWYTLNPEYLLLGLIILLAHGLSKACLFMTCGYTMHLAKTGFVDDVKVFLRFRQSYLALLLASVNLFGILAPSLGFIMTEKSIELSPSIMIPLLLISHIVSIILLMKIILRFWKLRKCGVESIDELELKDRFMEYSIFIIMVLPYLLYSVLRMSVEITVLTLVSQLIIIVTILLCTYFTDKIKLEKLTRVLKYRLALPYVTDVVISKSILRLSSLIYSVTRRVDHVIHSVDIFKLAHAIRNIDFRVDREIHFEIPRQFLNRICKIIQRIHVEKLIRDLTYSSIIIALILMITIIVLHMV